MKVPGYVAEAELACAEASADQFADIVQRLSHFVFRVANSVLRNPADAEDVVQEAFLKLYRSGAWRTMTDERAFLARTTWRLAVTRISRRRGAPLSEYCQTSTDASPETIAISAERNLAIHRLVDSLPEKLRQPLALSGVGMNSREIASAIGIGEATVRSRLAHARQILRQKVAATLGGRYGD